MDATFPVTVGNNYHTSSGVASLTNGDYQYLCSLFANGFYNTAYHNGENLEPVVGDYILYNNLYPPPQRLVQGVDSHSLNYLITIKLSRLENPMEK